MLYQRSGISLSSSRNFLATFQAPNRLLQVATGIRLEPDPAALAAERIGNALVDGAVPRRQLDRHPADRVQGERGRRRGLGLERGRGPPRRLSQPRRGDL